MWHVGNCPTQLKYWWDLPPPPPVLCFVALCYMYVFSYIMPSTVLYHNIPCYCVILCCTGVPKSVEIKGVQGQSASTPQHKETINYLECGDATRNVGVKYFFP